MGSKDVGKNYLSLQAVDVEGEGKHLGAHTGGHPEIREACAAQKDLVTVKGGCSAVRNVTESTGQGRVTEAV